MEKNNVLMQFRPGNRTPDELASPNGPLFEHGTIATGMVKKIINGGGKAEISMAALKTIADNEEGVHALFDNFIFTDPQTGKPLIRHLLDFYTDHKK